MLNARSSTLIGFDVGATVIDPFDKADELGVV
jgi:hypothetical protein